MYKPMKLFVQNHVFCRTCTLHYKCILFQIHGFQKLYHIIALNKSWPADYLQLVCSASHVFKKRSLSCFDYVRQEKQVIQSTSILTGWGLHLDTGFCFGIHILNTVSDYQSVLYLFYLKMSVSIIICLNRRGYKQNHFFLNICLITSGNSFCNDFPDSLISRSSTLNVRLRIQCEKILRK